MTDMLKLQQKLLPAAYKLQSFADNLRNRSEWPGLVFAYLLAVIKLLAVASEDGRNIGFVIYRYFNLVLTHSEASVNLIWRLAKISH